MWWLLWPAVAAAALLIAGTLLGRLLPRRHTALAGRHVLVTGGSSGIGRSLAVLCAKQGAHDAAAVRDAIFRAEQELGPLYFVACCAGFALAQRCEEMPIATHRRLMEVNYFGVLNVLHAAVPGLKARREGRIAVVTSLGGVVGLWGFTGYCASKYALVGLSHTLLQELKPYGVGVTLCYPPDTDTPGFEQENRTKPEETRLICETAGLFPPEKVAQKLLDDVMAGTINSTLAREVLLMPVFRLVVAFFHRSWDGIVRDCMR
ncbi:3-ketodihydrosphingosine reductase [Amphibalanus amphitrite]|uniref:3-ketodihydrosphingosine reductase n=1 Tax=Amphibalanus amphitrite TaxID=1232801 RepID=A0A6A4WJW6_AMPAM|nr:3-ketodihydrosphingosine reductase [Amphibalanus amphitrite]